MKAPLSLAIAVLAVALPAFWARADDLCATVPKLGSFVLEEYPMSFVVRHDVDAAGLDVKARTLTAYLGRGWHANGLASAASAFRTTTAMAGTQSAQGVCMGVSELKVTYGYPNPVEILVASHYPEGSCEYRAILTHEFRHYEIFRSSSFDIRDSIENYVAYEVSSRLPVRAPDAETAKAMIGQVVNAATHAAAAHVDEEAKRLNAMIDNPTSYHEVQAQCSNW